MKIAPNIIDRFKELLITTWILALCATCCVVGIDALFAWIAPKGFWNIAGNAFVDQGKLLLINGLLVFHIFVVIFLLSRFLGKIFLWACLSVGVFFYLTSWSTFIVVGEFLGVEGVRFVSHNFEDIVWLMSQISGWYLLALGALLLSPVLMYVFIMKMHTKASAFFRSKGLPSNVLLAATLTVSIAAFLLLVTIPKHLKPFDQMNLRLRVSPQAALFFDRSVKMLPKGFSEQGNYLTVLQNKIVPWPEEQSVLPTAVNPGPVIVIVIESMRSDILDDDTIMPNLFALRQEGQLIKPYTASNLTDYAWPALLSSQYPLRSDYHFYYPLHIDFPRITIYDVLKHAGFKTAIFSAQNEHWGGMYHFLNTGGLDVFFNSDSVREGQYSSGEDSGFAMFVKKFRAFGKLDDGQVVSAAMQWVSAIKTPQFFIAFNFQRPHFPYTWPSSFQPPFAYCAPQRWKYLRDMVPGMRGRYHNALRYTDMQIGRFIAFLKEKGLYDTSIIAVMGDHGEAFYEHYSPVHGNELFNETAITALVIKGKKGAPLLSLKKTPELMDLAPTLCDMVGLPPHPAFQGTSWFDPKPPQKPVFMTVNSPIVKQDAIVLDGWKLIKDLRSNKVWLYDLINDPKEQHDVFSDHFEHGKDLLFKLIFWRLKQTAYYDASSLKSRFYPPQFRSE